MRYADFKTDFPLSVHTRTQPASIFYHDHDFLEIVYIMRGSGTHRHAGDDFPVHHGDCFTILPGDRHAYLPRTSLTIVNICIHPSFFSQVRFDLNVISGYKEFISLEPMFRAETSSRYKLHLNAADQRRVEPMLIGMERDLHDAAGGCISAAGEFLRFIVFICGRYHDTVLSAKTIRSDFAGKSDAVERAIAYIEANINGDIRLSDVADAALLSTSRISARFKKATGLSPIDYLIKSRIDEAARLLRDTGLSVTDIAFKTGFHDSNYFTRMFRKETGKTPVAFRSGQ